MPIVNNISKPEQTNNIAGRKALVTQFQPQRGVAKADTFEIGTKATVIPFVPKEHAVKLDRTQISQLQEFLIPIRRDIKEYTRKAIAALASGNNDKYKQLKTARAGLKSAVDTANKILTDAQNGNCIDNRAFSKMFKGFHIPR